MDVEQLGARDFDTITILNDTKRVAQDVQFMRLTLPAAAVTLNGGIADQALNEAANMDVQGDLAIVRHLDTGEMFIAG